jgi:hypothetical protein
MLSTLEFVKVAVTTVAVIILLHAIPEFLVRLIIGF